MHDLLATRHRVLCDTNSPAPLIGDCRHIVARPCKLVLFGTDVSRVSLFAHDDGAAAADGAKSDGAVQRPITRAHGMTVIAGFDEPFTAVVRPAANDADMVWPYHDGTDLRPTGIRTDTRPVPCQIETRIGNAEYAAHIGAAPRAAMTRVMSAMNRCFAGMMTVIPMRGQGRRVQTCKRHRRDKQTTHTHLRFC